MWLVRPRAASATLRWPIVSRSGSACLPRRPRLRRWRGSAKVPRRCRRPSRPPTRSRGSVQRPETKARARALQLLYAWELSGRPTIETVVARVAVIYGRAPRGYDRGADLAAKAIAGLPEFDRRIADAAEHWRLQRVGAGERHILRLPPAGAGAGCSPSPRGGGGGGGAGGRGAPGAGAAPPSSA